jgi:hypothetical protein
MAPDPNGHHRPELEGARIAARRAHADLQLDGAAFAYRQVVLGDAALSDRQQAAVLQCGGLWRPTGRVR